MIWFEVASREKNFDIVSDLEKHREKRKKRNDKVPSR